MIFVFSYQRRKMLERLLSELKDCGQRIVVIDDGSDFKLDHVEWVSMPHGGKQRFWKNWHIALRLFEKSKDEFVLFIPDDVTDVNLEKIKSYFETFKNMAYVFNVLTDSRKRCWNGIKPLTVNDDIEQIGFVDCAFFTNRLTIDMIGYHMNPVSLYRFRNKNISSGVGQQLTSRINSLKIPIYRSVKSLVYHGDHSSVMHANERKKNPLLSIHGI